MFNTYGSQYGPNGVQPMRRRSKFVEIQFTSFQVIPEATTFLFYYSPLFKVWPIHGYFWPLINTSVDNWSVRRLGSSFDIFPGQITSMTRWRQALTKVWRFWVVVVAIFHMMLSYNNIERTLARNKLKLMLMLKYLYFQLLDLIARETSHSLFLGKHQCGCHHR